MESNVPIGKLNIGLPGFIFPSVSYVLLLHQQLATIDLGAHFIKQSPRNHFTILGANGPQKLSLPLESKKGLSVATSKMMISKGSWYKNQCTAIQSAYGKSAFYFHYKDEVNELMSHWPGQSLGSAIEASLSFLTKNFRLPLPHCEFEYQDASFDLDWRMHKTLFQPTMILPYHQVFSDRFDFKDQLSALDLLFNLGPESASYIQSHPILRLDLAAHQNSLE
jgi:WbqC-like protein family